MENGCTVGGGGGELVDGVVDGGQVLEDGGLGGGGLQV